jgi:hypothetical protein
MGLGFTPVSSDIRVPKPPARITAFMKSSPWLNGQSRKKLPNFNKLWRREADLAIKSSEIEGIQDQ